MLEVFMRYSEVSASWSAAMGATFAACVALWLGLRENRWREADRKNQLRHGVLYIASITNRVGLIIGWMDGIKGGLEGWPGATFDFESAGGTLQASITVLKDLEISKIDTAAPSAALQIMKLINNLEGLEPVLHNSIRNVAAQKMAIMALKSASDAADSILRALLGVSR